MATPIPISVIENGNIATVNENATVTLVVRGPQGIPGAVQSVSITSDGSIAVAGAPADLSNPAGAFVLSLPDIATAGTYRSVTVNAKGQFTAGTNPTTLAGYGITDAQPLDSDLSALAALATNGIIVRTGAGAATSRSFAVSGVGLSASNADGVSGNPTISSNATATNTASTIVARDGSGNFTAGTITATSNVTTDIKINSATVALRDINYSTNGTNRWTIRVNGTSEGGSNAGSDFQIIRRDDAGTSLGSSIDIVRSTGTISLNGSTSISGNLTATGYIAGSVSTAISAAGSTQGTATALTKQINVVSTVGAGQGVVLPSFAGSMFIVQNLGANALNVYPPSGAAIDSLSTNAAFSLPVGAKIMFFQISSALYGTLNATYG
jgi:hypothetical protein